MKDLYHPLADRAVGLLDDHLEVVERVQIVGVLEARSRHEILDALDVPRRPTDLRNLADRDVGLETLRTWVLQALAENVDRREGTS